MVQDVTAYLHKVYYGKFGIQSPSLATQEAPATETSPKKNGTLGPPILDGLFRKILSPNETPVG